jgi:hypothetical protein
MPHDRSIDLVIARAGTRLSESKEDGRKGRLAAIDSLAQQLESKDADALSRIIAGLGCG